MLGTVNVTGETGIRVGAGVSTKRMKTEGLREKANTCNWRFIATIVHEVEKCVKGEMLDRSELISVRQKNSRTEGDSKKLLGCALPPERSIFILF